ncbi:MAG: alternative ribosome rescue aminoacyl-tRNA hydrolase ArfB [Gemmatimonadota bacterium]
MNDDAWVDVTAALRIPRTELAFRASRASGPGGQHVNKTSSRIELEWDVAASPSLTDAQRARLLSRLASRLDTAGVLRIVSGESRSQLRNRDAVVERLADLVAAGLHVQKPRRKTKPSRAAKAARLEAKRRRSITKSRRGRGAHHDD